MRITLSNRAHWVLFVILLIVCVVLLVAGNVHAVQAQEVTATAVPTLTSPPVSVPSTPAPAVDPQSIVYIVGGFLVAIAAGGSFAAMLHRLDKRTKDEIERDYHALPPVWQDTILKVVETADALVKVAKEITDGQPNADPPLQ